MAGCRSRHAAHRGHSCAVLLHAKPTWPAARAICTAASTASAVRPPTATARIHLCLPSAATSRGAAAAGRVGRGFLAAGGCASGSAPAAAAAAGAGWAGAAATSCFRFFRSSSGARLTAPSTCNSAKLAPWLQGAEAGLLAGSRAAVCRATLYLCCSHYNA